MYTLGVDLGTTFTAAAVRRGGRAEVAQLGTRAAVVPSVVLQREDGALLVGEAAERRAVTEPDRVAREFKRRFGDPTPILLGGTPWSPQALTARLLSAVVEQVAEREGEQPAAICVCHPASWRDFSKDLLQQAVRLADLGGGDPISVGFVTEPEAAAAFYAEKIGGENRVAPGSTIAVYDLGGGTFDATVLRRTSTGFDILGQPEGIEHLGGVDVDAAVFAHVARALDGALDRYDEDDEEATAAVARLRRECTIAKEALSADTDVDIPVLLPGLSSEIRLTRGELEDAIRPALLDTVAALRRALRSADVEAEDLHSVLLVGGSSRIPMVSQLVGQELGRPVAVDADPKHAIALGAAWHAGRAQSTEVLPAVAASPPATPDTEPAKRNVPRQGADLPPPPPKRTRPAAPAASAAPPAAPAAPPPAATPPVVPRKAVPPRPVAVPRPAPPREPEPVTEVMRTAPAPTQIMPAAAWRPPQRVTARQPLLMPPTRSDAAPPPRRRRRTGLVVFVTLLALAAGAAGAVALSDLGRNLGSGTSTLTEPTGDDAATLPGAGATTGPVQNTDDQTRRKPRRKVRLRQQQQPTQAPTQQPAPEVSESVTPPPDTEAEGGGEPSVAPGDVEQNGELAPDDADADPAAVP
jgi:molecular chaperone DnaK